MKFQHPTAALQLLSIKISKKITGPGAVNYSDVLTVIKFILPSGDEAGKSIGFEYIAKEQIALAGEDQEKYPEEHVLYFLRQGFPVPDERREYKLYGKIEEYIAEQEIDPAHQRHDDINRGL